MIMLAVEFHQFRLKVSADARENATQIFNYFLCEHATAVFSHKDQVNMHIENTMSAVPYVIVYFHRPSII